MSYDLFFRSRDPSRTVGRDQFEEYFAHRQHYEIKKAQAFYSNPCTGVYFLFEYDKCAAEGDELLPITFNLNYFRPHIFGLEAEPELTSFVEALDLTVSDPQNEGMGDGEYSPDGFLKGWNAGNAFGYRSILSQHGLEAVRYSLPRGLIERCWLWNSERDALQAQYGEEVFIPQIFFLDHEGSVRSSVVWGDAIPIAIPEVDTVILARHELAPRGLLWKKKDHGIVPYAEIEPCLSGFSALSDPVPYHALRYTERPQSILDLFAAVVPERSRAAFVSVDEILDREMVALHAPEAEESS